MLKPLTNRHEDIFNVQHFVFEVQVEKHDFMIYKQEVTAILTETLPKPALQQEIW